MQPFPLTDQDAAAATAEDRRRSERHPLVLELRVMMKERALAVAGYTVNVSAAGALLRASVPLRVGAVYEFCVERPDGILSTRARVVRELDGHLYAVEFDTPLPEILQSDC